jgi:hypothetical protein
MKRNRILFMVVALMVGMLVATPLPAIATTPADSTVFFPVALGNGATYSCTGGPPFVNDPASPSQNCPLQQVGPPPGYVCDVPTSLTFIHDSYQYPANARLCQSNTAAG